MRSRVGLLLVAGATALTDWSCGSGGSSPDDAARADARIADASVADATPVDAALVDGAVADATPADAAPACGCTTGQFCDPSGVCQTGTAPLGGLCEPSATCKESDPSYPSCLDALCDSRTCGPGIPVFRNVCSLGCNIYQDNDADGVNDLDAPNSDCHPAGVYDGPAGNAYRCVNQAAPAQQPLGYCLPGTDFVACSSNSDCPADEDCELGIIGGQASLHCLARYRENTSWSGTVVRLGQTCNRDPDQGPLVYCADGPCQADGYCSAFCSTNADCDTTAFTPGQRCLVDTCENDSSVSCSVDADCSTAECGGLLDLGGGVTFPYCTAKP